MNCRRDTIRQLETNLDDLNPELYPHVLDALRSLGVKDCWITPCIMKKGRPGTVLSVLYQKALEEKVVALLFQETTAIGLRCWDVERYELERSFEQVQTKWGKISIKIAKDADGRVLNCKPEFSDCEAAAAKSGVPVQEVINEALTLSRTLKTSTSS